MTIILVPSPHPITHKPTYASPACLCYVLRVRRLHASAGILGANQPWENKLLRTLVLHAVQICYFSFWRYPICYSWRYTHCNEVELRFLKRKNVSVSKWIFPSEVSAFWKWLYSISDLCTILTSICFYCNCKSLLITDPLFYNIANESVVSWVTLAINVFSAWWWSYDRNM
jgi:hypothetical protein